MDGRVILNAVVGIRLRAAWITRYRDSLSPSACHKGLGAPARLAAGEGKRISHRAIRWRENGQRRDASGRDSWRLLAWYALQNNVGNV